ncbi:MAG TPA: aminotransferase class III-fold pyridoxal phosphate-dependent enzyme [Chitinophagaceae bacterium]|nr:aminotransferase class III-fold pyridoxal phosphate-dependent enzyme [Chitinophagaceae bacterium]
MEKLKARQELTNVQEILRDNFNHTLFSWSKQKGISPLAIHHGRGVHLFDYDGRRYIDFSSGLMNVNIGHGHPRVTEAVMRQMQEISYVTPACVTKARGELGRKLAAITPHGLNKALFTVGGAEAIENAIKLARMYTGRHKILTRYQSFHGASYGAISAGGDPRKLPMDAQQAPNIVHFDIPITYRWQFGENTLLDHSVETLERVIAFEGPNNIAAILLEGESGTSGCLKYPPGFLKKVRELCDRYGIVFIADEVMSGFGRTGKWFGVENHEVVPDMIATAKGITSGYLPLGALLVSDRIAARYDDEVLWLGLTYSAHPVCCAAAVEVLAIYEDEGLLANAAAMGRYVDNEMEKMREKHPSIGDWRNTGLLGCLELVKNRKTREPMAPFNAGPQEMAVMNQVNGRLRELGMYTFVRWNYIFVAPPLCIKKEEVDEGLAIISEALRIADEATS